MDRPRGFDPDRFDEAVGYEVEMATQGIAQLDVELINNEFSGDVYLAAERMFRGMGLSLHDLPEEARLPILQLAARTIRELSNLYIHRLTQPAKPFEPYDGLFARPTPNSAHLPLREAASKATIGQATKTYIARTKARGVGQSHITETARALGWLAEVVGDNVALERVTSQQMREFRNDLQRIDKRLRGRNVAFDERLTNNPEHQILYPTSSRYWRSVQGFFSWAVEEQLLSASPADVAKIVKPKGLKTKSPPPFTSDELLKVTKSPLYAGYRSIKQVKVSGSCRVRSGHWWSGVLFMYTGLRAGELSQLQHADFDFTGEIPHLKVREEGSTGLKEKSVKNYASIRDVPLHPRLLTLGLKEFVERRAKRYPERPVFFEFRLGTNGRKSEGATRFWGDYLKANGLWLPGRSTHVWRHTVAAFLRKNCTSEEDIAAIVGHASGDKRFSQTQRYGGAYPLNRKLDTILSLEFGFDVVAALGGPYDPKLHG